MEVRALRSCRCRYSHSLFQRARRLVLASAEPSRLEAGTVVLLYYCITVLLYCGIAVSRYRGIVFLRELDLSRPHLSLHNCTSLTRRETPRKGRLADVTTELQKRESGQGPFQRVADPAESLTLQLRSCFDCRPALSEGVHAAPRPSLSRISGVNTSISPT